MAWLGTIGTNNTINEGTHYVTEQVVYTMNGTVIATSERKNAVVTMRYTGLTGSAAADYVGSHYADSDVIDICSQRLGVADGYCVIEQKIVYGTW
jgi:hypothetical protein